MKRAMAIAAGIIAFAACASAQSSEYWTDPNTGERIKILESRPVPLNLTAPSRCSRSARPSTIGNHAGCFYADARALGELAALAKSLGLGS
jgi:hypothetical protein